MNYIKINLIKIFNEDLMNVFERPCQGSGESLGVFKSLKCILFILFALGSLNSVAQNLITGSVPITQSYEVAVGKSSLLLLKQPAMRIAVSNPGIAYVLQISSKEWEIIGRNVGVTDLYIWSDYNKVIGAQVSVSLPAPPYFRASPTMELVNGNSSELIYMGHPSEHIPTSSTRKSGIISDMPEPCLLPGCL